MDDEDSHTMANGDHDRKTPTGDVPLTVQLEERIRASNISLPETFVELLYFVATSSDERNADLKRDVRGVLAAVDLLRNQVVERDVMIFHDMGNQLSVSQGMKLALERIEAAVHRTEDAVTVLTAEKEIQLDRVTRARKALEAKQAAAIATLRDRDEKRQARFEAQMVRHEKQSALAAATTSSPTADDSQRISQVSEHELDRLERKAERISMVADAALEKIKEEAADAQEAVKATADGNLAKTAEHRREVTKLQYGIAAGIVTSILATAGTIIVWLLTHH